jgi:putative peptidoglycan lipid II flippase
LVEPTDITEATTPPVLPVQPDAAENGIIRAAAILAVGNVAQRLLGMAREIVKAYLFGASGLLSAYEIAVYVPLNLYELIIGGMVNSALVPVFSDFALPRRREELWGIVSAFLSVATVVLLLVIILVELFAPQIAAALGARNFEDPALLDLSVRLMRLATPAIFFLSISSILTGVLYALKRFMLPALTASIFNAAIVIVALARPEHIESLVWGLLLGSVLQIVIQVPGLRDARLRWRLEWHNPVIHRILRLYAPIVGGLIITQVGLAASINLATRTGDASLTYMRYATTLYQFPLGLVVTALSIATLPTLSQQATGRLADFKQTLAEGIRLVVVLILPATIGLFILALPIVALLFQYGEFTPADTEITGTVLRYYLFGLPFAAVDQMLVFASYARKDTLRPALVGVFSIIIYVGVAALLLEPYGILSLMIADAVKHVVHMGLMVLVLARQGIWLGGHGILNTFFRSAIAAAITGVVAYALFLGLSNTLSLAALPGRLLLVLLPGITGLFVFAGLVYLLNIQEAKSLRSLVSRRKAKQNEEGS